MADRADDEVTTLASLTVHTRGDLRALDSPVVVLLHGYASCARDLAPLFEAFSRPDRRPMRFLFPEGPCAIEPIEGGAIEGGSRAWWNIDVAARDAAMARGEERDLSRQAPPGIAQARAALDRLLDVIETDLAPSALIVGGFSQGAILACDATLRSSRSIAGLVLLSGARVTSDEWQALYSARRGLPVFQSHGHDDTHLSFAAADRLHHELASAGLEVTWIPFAGGHETPLPVLRALRKFLRRYDGCATEIR